MSRAEIMQFEINMSTGSKLNHLTPPGLYFMISNQIQLKKPENRYFPEASRTSKRHQPGIKKSETI